MLHKYFVLWKRKIRNKKEKVANFHLKFEQNEKLNTLIKTLKKYKKEHQQSRHVERPLSSESKPLKKNYQNRFEAQKSTIEKLTLKLEEKDKLIEELKLGILDKEAFNTINETKVDIRKIFANCSAKVRCKLAPPPDYSEKFMITTQKAPKIIQEMEGRALERAKRREAILRRKQAIEENRKRMIAEALEKKRVQDEEEKKRNLEMIKERRRKELQLEKLRQERKIVFLEKQCKAVALHNHKLLTGGLRILLTNYKEAKLNHVKSVMHFKVQLTRKALAKWLNFIEDTYKDKNALADAFMADKILSRTLIIWQNARIEGIRCMQVAEDFSELLLLNNTFVHWHRYVCIQIMLREKQIKLAKRHYNRRLLFHYFYQWRTLPAVIQLEKSKEEKKRKWRAKVWEVLPNYKPPLDDPI